MHDFVHSIIFLNVIYFIHEMFLCFKIATNTS